MNFFYGRWNNSTLHLKWYPTDITLIYLQRMYSQTWVIFNTVSTHFIFIVHDSLFIIRSAMILLRSSYSWFLFLWALHTNSIVEPTWKCSSAIFKMHCDCDTEVRALYEFLIMSSLVEAKSTGQCVHSDNTQYIKHIRNISNCFSSCGVWQMSLWCRKHNGDGSPHIFLWNQW